MNNPPDKQRTIRLALLAVLTAVPLVPGILLRCQGLNRFFEYDEVWTICRYAVLPWHEIFTELATPNNHCLHSLLVKWCCDAFGTRAELIRLPALIAGIAAVFLAVCAAWKTTRQPGPLIMTVIWAAFQADLIHYSRTARGYSLQIFFVLAFFLLLRNRLGKPEHCSWKTAMLLFLSAAGACLSVTSGLIFVCACGGAFLICLLISDPARWKKIPLPLAVSGGLFLLAAGAWYGSLYTTLKQGQQFGTELSGAADFFRFCAGILTNMHLIPLLVLTAAGLCVRKRNPFRSFFSFTLIFCALVLLSALLTKAGPTRVYLPLYLPLVVSGSAALTVLCGAVRRPRWNLAAGLLASVFPVAVFSSAMEEMEPPGSEHIASEIMTETRKDVVIVYRRADEVPVLFNCPEALPDLKSRLSYPGGLSGLLVLGRKDALEVMNGRGENIDVPLEKGYAYKELPPKKEIPLTLFELEPVTENMDLSSGPLLMNVQPSIREDSVFRHASPLRIGAILTAGLHSDTKELTGLYLWDKPSLTGRECVDAEARTGKGIRFYRLRKASKKEGGPNP